MSERFFLSTSPRDGRAVLDGDEARHLARVLRCAVGDPICVFDGTGTEWPARVASIARDQVIVELGEPVCDEPPPGVRLTVAVALPKGERQKWLVEKLTELGTGRLVPLVTTRGVAEPTPAAVERLRRGVIEACKQCGRRTLMEIGMPQSIGELVGARHPGSWIVVADPGAPPLAAGAASARGLAVIALVGPEGGFTPEEFAALDAAGIERVGLGPHVLRVETAAIAVAARLA
jgi:16S rRNA (uracil1498-N3)-methyltransferase